MTDDQPRGPILALMLSKDPVAASYGQILNTLEMPAEAFGSDMVLRQGELDDCKSASR